MIKQNCIIIDDDKFGLKKLKENEIEKAAFAILGEPINQGPTPDERTAEALTKTPKSVSTGPSSVPLDKSGTKNDDNEKGMLSIYYSCVFI